MQKTAWPARINDETGADRKLSPLTLARDLRTFIADGNASGLCPIEILDSNTLRFTNEKMIEVRAIPVRVRNFIARTGRHEQLVASFRIVCEWQADLMMVKREAAFQAAGNLRICLLPRPPFGQWQQPRQIVSARQLLQQKVRQRRGGFTNDKPRMPAALQQNDRTAKSPGNHRHERTAKARTNDRDVKIGVHST